MPQPGVMLAPRMNEPQQRIERIRSVLSQFGIDVEKFNDFLKNPLVNAGTPMEEIRTFFVPANLDDRAEVARAVAGELVGGKHSVANQCRGCGISAFCESEEDMMRLLGSVFSALSKFEAGQEVVNDTRRWLQNTQFGLPSTMLEGMSLRNQNEWMANNFENFINAALFQAWAKERGIEQPIIDEAGKALYGELWDYASAVGLYLERKSDGTWFLKGGEGTHQARMALKRLGPMPVSSNMEETADQARGVMGQVPVLTEMDRFERHYSKGMFNTPAQRLISGGGWARDNFADLFQGVDSNEVMKAAAFYIWARDAAGIGPEQIDALGKQNFEAHTWNLGSAMATHLSPVRGRRGQYYFKTSDVDALRADLEKLRAEGRPAAEAVEAGETRVAAPATAQGRARECLIELFRKGVNIEFRYVGEAESGKPENTLNALEEAVGGSSRGNSVVIAHNGELFSAQDLDRNNPLSMISRAREEARSGRA